MRTVLFAMTLILVGACSKGSTPSQEPTETPRNPTAGESSDDDAVDESEEAAAMHERFVAVNAIRDAVIAGDHTTAKDRANKLAKGDNLRSVLADWGQFTKNLQTEVKATAESADLGSAAMHTAAAADACGRCHESVGVATLDEKVGLPPAEAEDVNGIMRRHRWATNRMWDGLVAPSRISWDAGAKALVESAKNAQQQPQLKSDKELSTLLGDVEKLATEAAEAVTGPERTQALGKLLSTCSACHQKMKLGGGPSKAQAGAR